MNRIVVTAGVSAAVVGALAAGLNEAQARGRRSRDTGEKDLVVTLMTPTNNQEVLPQLRDPGLNNQITVRFSSNPRVRDIIDTQNVFNRLTPKVEFTDATFARLPGVPSVRGNVFTFNPLTQANNFALPQGQYTLNIKSSLRNARGRLLNSGVRDFSSTFSVGTDVFSPVLRKISPIDTQTNIGLNQRVVMTFNEPIDPSSLVGKIQVQDASTNPPRPIAGAGGTGITLERNGFDVVFTPDPCFGYPPKTTIQFLVQGRNQNGTAAAITDAFGNPFRRDSGLHWSFNAAAGVWESPNGTYDEITGLFRMQFVTKGVTPAPVALPPGSPQHNTPPIAGPCFAQTFFSPSCYAAGRVVLFTTSTGLGEIDLSAFIQRVNQGINNQYDLINVLQNSPVRLGRPAGVMVDPRWDAASGFHTFIYVVDERSASVLVLDSRNLKVISRFSGFTSPKDIAIATDGGLNRITAYISDYGSGNLVAIDFSAFRISFPVPGGGQPGALSPCEEIKDVISKRVFIPTGRGTSGVAADSYLQNRVMAVNTLDNSATLVDVKTNKVLKTLTVGSNPVDVDWTYNGFGFRDFALVANQGGLVDPDGSLSLYVRSPSFGGYPGAAQTRNGIESTFTEGIENPVSVWGNQQWASPFSGDSVPQAWYVPNTGGRTVVDLTLQLTGLFGISITVQPGFVRDVGFNPTSVLLDGFYPNNHMFAAVAGQGQLAAGDRFRDFPVTHITVPGIRKIYTAFSH